MAMVFQKPVLFKGNVYYNVAYGLKVRNTEQSIVASLVQQALEMVGLEGENPAVMSQMKPQVTVTHRS